MRYLSNETTASLQRILIREGDDLYPDTAASDNTVKNANATVWRLPDIVPSTTKDMSVVFTWENGDPEPYGTHAKANKAMADYRRDINSAPDIKDYKPIYLDTFKKISDERKKWGIK